MSTNDAGELKEALDERNTGLAEAIVLKRYHIACDRRMSSECLDYMVDVQAYFDHMTRDWVFNLSKYIYGEQLREITYPQTWWDAVKDRFFPDWLKARFPVHHMCFKIAALYPEISLPEKRAVLKVFRSTLTDAGKGEGQ